jgi:hypothetical protein
MTRQVWTRDELIVAFNLYCKLRFGQCHRRNPQVVALAKVLGRTPNAVAMKLCNFASFDPAHQERGVVGLANVSRADKEIWDEFNANWADLGVASEKAFRELLGGGVTELPEGGEPEPSEDAETGASSTRQTEAQCLQSVRLGQAFFRATVLASYQGQCCLCRLPCKALLIASHIVPWAVRPDLRLDPRNGLCLCAIHDKAFDRGLLSVDACFRALISPRLHEHASHSVVVTVFLAFKGQQIAPPEKFRPSPEYLEYHRDRIFQSS